MQKNKMPFDSEYSKLSFAVFPTIRRRDKYGSVGDTHTIEHREKANQTDIGEAKIIAKETVTLDNLPEQFLLWDTESDNWDEAYDTLCGFYDGVIEPHEELTLYWNLWTEKYD